MYGPKLADASLHVGLDEAQSLYTIVNTPLSISVLRALCILCELIFTATSRERCYSYSYFVDEEIKLINLSQLGLNHLPPDAMLASERAGI